MSIIRPRIAIAAVVACMLAAAPAAARHAGGATYGGTYGDNAGHIRFTVSADGQRLTSYRIDDVAGDTCRFYAQGDDDQWQTPVSDERFEYRLYDAILFRGTFAADGRASGVFRLTSTAVPGVKPACDTGIVSWTAEPTAAPTAGDGDAGGGSGTAGTGDGATGAPGGAPGSGGGRTTIAVRTSLDRISRSATSIAGRIRASRAACRPGRTVVLRNGTRTVATTRSKADGSFRFARTRAVRGRSLTIRVLAHRRASVTCGAAMSETFKA